MREALPWGEGHWPLGLAGTRRLLSLYLAKVEEASRIENTMP